MEKLRIASFDIGVKNFAFCIEDIDKTLTYQSIPKENRYNPNGTPTEQFSDLIKSICNNGKITLFKNNDLTKNCCKDKRLDPESFHNLTELLDTYTEYWDKCDIILIEQQMSFGKKYNTIALKIGQHTFSYFILKYGRDKKIIEYPSYHKTQILGAPKIEHINKKGIVLYKSIDKPARKKWSIKTAINILTDRDETEILSQLTTQKKKDDLADVLTQLQSFKILYFLDNFIPIV